MPGKVTKHVRFAEDVDVLPTPSPTFSVASLPSSCGPLTPPPDMPVTSYLSTPVNVGGVPVAIHPVLAFAGTMFPPHLAFNVTLPAENVRPMDLRVLHEDATSPRLHSLVLVHPRLSYRAWQITITPAEGKYVRVCDVLEGIYKSLRQQATAADYESLPSRDAQKEATAAFTRRWMQMPDSEMAALERSKGLKRVDFLGTSTFGGLSQSPHGPNYWDLLLL
ncbi:hypothetical protein GGX14DRAFT_642749 [Mycena pura]|uniref:DUF6699 domain-containing protein n=1 Tax=Mycena pura TaxID=153505 RepID=A0AAD7E3D5_9AGAR|nr:hypothetical protein GGX14DRAFT_642749 [Mycena pura]